MAYDHGPRVTSINPRKIDMPDDPAVKAAYLELGWIELRGVFEGEPYLKWPFDLRSPEHPGQPKEPPYVPPCLLSQLPMSIRDKAHVALPWASDTDAKQYEVRVTLTLRYKRKYVGSKRSSRPSYAWVDEGATMVVEGAKPIGDER